jgi:hypothetical protein
MPNTTVTADQTVYNDARVLAARDGRFPGRPKVRPKLTFGFFYCETVKAG